VIAFVGDGGSMYTIQALWTAHRYGVAAKFVICNNGKYELLAENMSAYWREQGITPHEFPDSFSLTPDIGFVQLAQSLGVDAVRVEKPAEAAAAVQRMLSSSGPFLLDVLVDRAV
jgi:benzoylformate decarboxylase